MFGCNIQFASIAAAFSPRSLIKLVNSVLATPIINPGFVDTEMTKVNKFPMPFIVSAKFAAVKIFDGLKKNKYEINFPFYFSFHLAVCPFYNQIQIY